MKPAAGAAADAAALAPSHTEGCETKSTRGIGDLHFFDGADGLLLGGRRWVESGFQLDVRLRGYGRVIPHARLKKSSASTSLALSIAVVETAFGATAMPPPGATKAIAAGDVGARAAAVDVTPVAVGADREYALAAWTPRQS